MTERTGTTEQRRNGGRTEMAVRALLRSNLRCSFLRVIPFAPYPPLTRGARDYRSSAPSTSRGRARRRRPRADRRRLGPRPPARTRVAKDIDIEVFGMPGDRLRSAARVVRPRRGRRRELSGLQDRRHRRVAAAARIEGRARPQRLRRHRRSRHVDRGGRAAARLHDQRDLLGSADRRVPRSVRRPRRSRAAPACASSIRATFARRQPARAARGAVRRALRARRSTPRRARSAATIPLDDLPAERIWGEIREAAARAAAVDRLRARAGPRRRRRAVSGAAGARRLPAGAGVASRRRRLGAHAAGHRPGAHAHRRPAAPAAARRDARRGLPRPRQAGDDGVHRRPDPIARSRGAGRRAGDGVARSPERALDRRLRRAPAGARHHRAASEAGHRGSRCATKSATARSAGWRRRSISSCWRASRSPTASAAARRVRLLGDGLVPRARARARRRASAAGADPARPSPARARA